MVVIAKVIAAISRYQERTRMAVDSKRKAACQAAIHAHMEHFGARHWDTVRRDFEDIPQATFWRLVRDTKKQTIARKVDDLAARAEPVLPTVPSIGDLRGAIDPQAVLSACLQNANAVIDYAKSADGRVRNAKLLIAATRAMTEILRTAAAVSSTLLDERQTRDFYRAIMDEMAAESPQLRARVAVRFEALNSEMGLKSYIGR
jgi:hypothetical protein